MLRNSGEVLSGDELSRVELGFETDVASGSDFGSSEEPNNDFNQRLYENSATASRLIRDHFLQMEITYHHERDVRAKRDECLAYLKKQRESEFFQTVKQAVLNGQKISAAEYYYFALTTDNIKLVDLDLLDSACERFDFAYSRADGGRDGRQRFEMGADDAFAVLKAALGYQRAESDEAKQEYVLALNDAIQTRKRHFGNLPSFFVNLAGMDVAGADLTKSSRKRGSSLPTLGLADLHKANFQHCKMHSVSMTGCNVSEANFADVVSYNGNSNHGPCIKNSIARNANFDRFQGSHLMWRGTDCTGSSFKDATLGSVGFDRTVFDKCDFSGALINFREYQTREASFKNANLGGAKLVGVDCLHNDFAGARFIKPEAMKDVEAFKAGISDAMSNAAEVPHIAWILHAFQAQLAQDIARCIKEKDMPDALRAAFFDAAIQHPAFHVNETFKERMADRAKYVANTAGTLFNCCGTIYSSNEAVSYLEHERDGKSLEVGVNYQP